MKASVRARLARLEAGVRHRMANPTKAQLKTFWAKLEHVAEQPKDRPLDQMSLHDQAAYAIFGEVSLDEAEDVLSRFKAHAADIPGLDKLGNAIRTRIIADGRAAMRALLSPSTPSGPKSNP